MHKYSIKHHLGIVCLVFLPNLAWSMGPHAGQQMQSMPHTMAESHMQSMPHTMAESQTHSEQQAHRHEASPSFGEPGNAAQATRAIDVTMGDNMRFSPERIQVAAGETIRFVVKNEGKLPHEMVLGNMQSLLEHAQEMRSMSNMPHAEPNMLGLQGGEKGELIWRFNQTGMVDFACLIPGHYEAGMVGKINVSAQ